MENKQKLREKLRKKKESRKNAQQPMAPEDLFNGETDILAMMNRVNTILKTNPQMVQQISKCVSNVMNNRDLMSSLSKQVEDQIQVQDQTLESNSEAVSVDAVVKESTQ